MKLICIGGPKHGVELSYQQAGDRYIPRVVNVPVLQPLIAVATYDSDPWTVRPSLTYATYETKVVADRLVWVYVGSSS